MESLGFVTMSKQRNGVVYGFNLLWNMVGYFDSFHSVNPYMCYLQDDLRSMEDEWLLKVIELYEAIKDRCPIGFFSGHDTIEHPVMQTVSISGRNVLLKKSQGMTNVIGENFGSRSGKPEI
jgi:hypothetical protein